MKEKRKHPAGRPLWLLALAVTVTTFLLKLYLPMTAFAAEAGGRGDPGSLAPPGRSGIGTTLGNAYVLGPDDSEGGIMTLSADGSLCTIAPGAAHRYDSWDTTEFLVATETGQYAGFCAQPGKNTPSGTYQVAKLDNDNIKVMLLCGAGGPFEEAFCPALFGGNDWYAYTHAVIGYLYCGDLTGLNAGSVQGILNIRNWTYGVLGLDANSPGLRNDTVIAALEEYTLYVAYNNDQDIVWLELDKKETPKGRIEVKKAEPSPGKQPRSAVRSTVSIAILNVRIWSGA